VLSKIGRLAMRWSRPLEGTPKTVTLRREADGWYVAISCAGVPLKPLPRTGVDTGIDLGLESFATLATGEPIANPRLVRVAERRLRRAQRRISPQAGQPPQAQGGPPARPSPSAGPSEASRLPPQDRALADASVRHHLL
jgi:putative transposase